MQPALGSSSMANDEASSAPPPPLVDYVGEVTKWLGPSVLVLDGQYLLFLCHLAPRTRLGVRIGATVHVFSAHVLHTNPSPASDRRVATLVGFGLCTRGQLRVVRHASIARTNVGPLPKTTRSSCRDCTTLGRCARHQLRLDRLARQLTLHEMAACHEAMLDAGGTSRATMDSER